MLHSEEYRDLEEEVLISEDGLPIDPETGEIIADPLQVQVQDLPDVARRIRALQRRVDIIREFERQEIERIAGACSKKVLAMEAQVDWFISRAEQLLAETGKDEIDYPGLGKFRFGMTRESVVTEVWDNMSDEDKRRVHVNNTMIFHDPARKDVLERISPDKREIARRLKNGTLHPDVFRLSEKERVFQFKPEK